MQTMLAIDTSFGKFSIAIFEGENQIAYFENDEYTKQAEMLIPEIENLLAVNNLIYQNITKIACCIGPGSFTGLRIGIAAAKGLQLALGIEAVGISSLQASAIAQNGGKVFLDAKRGQAYAQEFGENLKPISDAELIDYEGNFTQSPNATLIAQASLTPYAFPLKPLYIRKPDAKLPAQSK